MRFAFVAVAVVVLSPVFVACSNGGGGRHVSHTSKDMTVGEDLADPNAVEDLKKVDQKGQDLSSSGSLTITSFTADPTSSLSEAPITFTVVVDLPSGDSVLAAQLTDTNKALDYGQMSSTGFSGSYERTLTWAAISAAQTLEFTGGSSRTFKVVVATAAGKTAEKTVTVSFSCNGLSACDGACVDTDSSSQHCGGCNMPCSSGCSSGICSGLGSASMTSCQSVTSTSRTCTDVCTSAGFGSCVQAGCGGQTAINYWDSTCGTEHATSAGSCSSSLLTLFSGTISSDSVVCCCQ